MRKFLLIICAVGLLISGCGEKSDLPTLKTENIPVAKEKVLNKSIKIQVSGKIFKATLEDKRSARAFAEMLPLEVEMTELNGNEKYFYLDDDLPTDSVRVMQIHAGDLMLYESNCVVLFHKDFSTNESYTRLGKIDNPADLEKILGKDNVHIKFEE